MDASQLTILRRAKTLYADSLAQKQLFNNGQVTRIHTLGNGIHNSYLLEGPVFTDSQDYTQIVCAHTPAHPQANLTCSTIIPCTETPISSLEQEADSTPDCGQDTMLIEPEICISPDCVQEPETQDNEPILTSNTKKSTIDNFSTNNYGTLYAVGQSVKFYTPKYIVYR